VCERERQRERERERENIEDVSKTWKNTEVNIEFKFEGELISKIS
jgi:hypothetical protein